MIKMHPYICIAFLFSWLGFAEMTDNVNIHQTSQAKGYEIYQQYCLTCHDMKIVTPKQLKERKMPPHTLTSPWHENKGSDLSLLYKQKQYSSEQLWDYLYNFSNHHSSLLSFKVPEENKKYLFTFIDWANHSHKVTAIRLGILSFIYLSVLLMFWGLWAIKLQHRVIRRYDRYDVPSFPKNAPENLTKASNDP